MKTNKTKTIEVFPGRKIMYGNFTPGSFKDLVGTRVEYSLFRDHQAYHTNPLMRYGTLNRIGDNFIELVEGRVCSKEVDVGVSATAVNTKCLGSLIWDEGVFRVPNQPEKTTRRSKVTNKEILRHYVGKVVGFHRLEEPTFTNLGFVRDLDNEKLVLDCYMQRYDDTKFTNVGSNRVFNFNDLIDVVDPGVPPEEHFEFFYKNNPGVRE